MSAQPAQPANRLLVMVFAVLALLLQSYAAQTHFHPGPAASIQTAGKHHQPVGDDGDNCPLCHSFYYGQYIAPAMASWVMPVLAVSFIGATRAAIPHYDAASHNWRGRGPPKD